MHGRMNAAHNRRRGDLFRSSRWPSLVSMPVLVLLIGFLTTAAITLQLRHTIEEREAERFDRLASDHVSAIRDKLETHIALLRGGAGLIASDGRTSRAEFETFVERLRLPRYYPGVQGIGFARMVRPGEAGELVQRAREMGYANFSLRPEGDRDVITTILYLSPFDRRNAAAIGFDMYSEPTRREAMARARDGGRAAMSGKVSLVQEIDPAKQAGFLIYVPVFPGGDVPPSIADRRSSIIGWVYSPFRAGDLFETAFARDGQQPFEFAVYDGPAPDSEALLYSSLADARPIVADSSFLVRRIEVAGRVWTIVLAPSEVFAGGSHSDLVPYFLIGGIVVTLFLAGAAWRQSQARHGAETANARMQAVLESVSDGFYALDPQWRFTVFNAAAERYFEKSREEVLGRTLWEVFPEVPGTEFEHRFRRVVDAGEPITFEARSVSRPDRMVEMRAARKTTGGLAVSFTDITERRAQADAVAQLAAEHEAVLGQLDEGVIVTDATGRIRFVNDAAARLHGVARLDVEPDEYSRTYHLFTEDGAPHPPRELPLARAVMKDEVVQDARWRIRRADGSEVLAIGNARPVRDEAGRKIGAVLTIRDDTARSAAEEALRQRSSDLAAANEEIQRVAYIISHDLRAPLVNIMGFTSELESLREPIARFYADVSANLPAGATAKAQAAIEEDLPEAIGFIRTSAAKMDRLIGAILKLSREGRRVLVPEPVDVQAVVEATRATLDHQLDEAGAVLEIEGLPALFTDRLAIEQIFGNLIENAIKYRDPERPARISVRGRDAGPCAEYVIEDNGRGIDPKDHERIFELFRRSGRQDRPGEGIGLANVRALVRRLGGSIRVSSELGRGSSFILTLPKVMRHEEGATE